MTYSHSIPGIDHSAWKIVVAYLSANLDSPLPPILHIHNITDNFFIGSLEL